MNKRRIRIGSTVAALVFTLSFSFTAWASDLPSAAWQLKPTIKVDKQTVLAKGVTYKQISGKTPGQEALIINALEVDTSLKDVEVRPVIAPGGITQREKLSAAGARTGAVAAINGTFFSMSSPYLPVGNLAIDGKFLAISDMLRTSMGIFNNGSVKFGYFKPGLVLKVNGVQDIAITGVNRTAYSKDVMVYTPEWGKTAGTGKTENLISLAPDQAGKLTVVEKTLGKINIPREGYVVQLPADVAGAFWEGSAVELKMAGDDYWNGVKHLLTSGPLLIENGEPVFQAIAEGFTGSLLKRNPRTAIGVTKEGKMVMAVVDGRGNESVGATFEELSYIMLGLGAHNAMALDGGGSTEMWVQGKIVNKPSGGIERALNNSLVVITGIPVYLNGERVFFDVPPQLINNRTMVPFRKIFEALGAQVDYEPATKMITATKDDRVVQFKSGAKTAMVDGQTHTLDVPARELNGRTLVPLRFTGVALGGTVDWTADQTVVINVR